MCCRSTVQMPVGAVGAGIKCSTVKGYVMYTPLNAPQRFGIPTGTDHFVCVEYSETDGWVLVKDLILREPFMPESTDLLVAEADIRRGVVPLVYVSQKIAVYGISTSYIGGDVTFTYDTCDGEELVCVCVCTCMYGI